MSKQDDGGPAFARGDTVRDTQREALKLGKDSPAIPIEATQAAERWFEGFDDYASREGDIRHNGWCGADGLSLARAFAAHADAEHARRLREMAIQHAQWYAVELDDLAARLEAGR